MYKCWAYGLFSKPFLSTFSSLHLLRQPRILSTRSSHTATGGRERSPPPPQQPPLVAPPRRPQQKRRTRPEYSTRAGHGRGDRQTVLLKLHWSELLLFTL